MAASETVREWDLTNCTMMDSIPSPALLNEYGLTDYHWEILQICKFPTYWKGDDDRLTHSITALYKLRDRGLLSGPQTGRPRDVPFELTAAGRDLLNKIERGLHHPKWLSEHKLNALKRLLDSMCTRGALLGVGVPSATLGSLEKAGYIVHKPIQQAYAITSLGREALANWGSSQIDPAPADSPNYGGARL